MLSNVHFTGEKDLEFRSGGDVDHNTLVTLFKLLGYNVHVLHDQTAQVPAAGKAGREIRVGCTLGLGASVPLAPAGCFPLSVAL